MSEVIKLVLVDRRCSECIDRAVLAGKIGTGGAGISEISPKEAIPEQVCSSTQRNRKAVKYSGGQKSIKFFP